MKILLKSFGLKAVSKQDGSYKLPSADIYLDCRILPNPHYANMPSGDSQQTQDWLMKRVEPAVLNGFISSILQGMQTLGQRRINSANKDASTLRVATFCAFGIHRSVAMKHLLAEELKARGIEVEVI